MLNFPYNNFKFKKHEQESYLMVTGEITNNTGRNYNAVVFRMVVFIKTIPIANVAIIVNGFYANQTKPVEVRVGELEYRIIPEITRYDIYAESAY